MYAADAWKQEIVWGARCRLIAPLEKEVSQIGQKDKNNTERMQLIQTFILG